MVMAVNDTEEELNDALSRWKSFKGKSDDIIRRSIQQTVSQALLFLSHSVENEEPNNNEADALIEGVFSHLVDEADFNTLASIPKLEENMEHWDSGNGEPRASFLLNQWILGAAPPPRCAAAKSTGCVMPSVAEGACCIEFHRCMYPTECGNQREDDSFFCRQHRCSQAIDIDKVCPDKTLPGMAYCVNHCCTICYHFAFELVRPDLVKSTKRVQQSNFCKEHKCLVLNCMKERILDDGEQEFCVSHACTECTGVRKRVDEQMSESMLCAEHRCSHLDPVFGPCGLPKYPQSLFCANHTCRVCEAEGLPLDRVVYELPPRNVCDLHPVYCAVSGRGDLCNERVSEESLQYCERHARVEFQTRTAREGPEDQCAWTTRKGKRCKTKGFSVDGTTFYCDDHFDQKKDFLPVGESSDEEEDGEDEGRGTNAGENALDEEMLDVAPAAEYQCHGQKKKGGRCKATTCSPNGIRYFCEDREDQKPPLRPVQCSGTTSKGNRCK